VSGVAPSVYPSADGVGVASSLVAAAETGTVTVCVAPGGFLAILDLVSRIGTAGAAATTATGATVGGAALTVYPSVDGVGVASSLAAAAETGTVIVCVAPGGFLAILDLVSRIGTAGAAATTATGAF